MHASYEKLKTNENSVFLSAEFEQYRLESPFHYHDEIELIFIHKGEGKLFVGDKVTPFHDNECYLFDAGLPHCFYNLSRKAKKRKKVHGFLFQFGSDFLGIDFLKKDEVIKLQKLFKRASFGIQFSGLSQETVRRLFEAPKSKGVERIANLLLILHDLINHKKVKLLTTQVTNIQTPTDLSKNILDVYQYVYENFNKKISFSKAASIAHMQRAAFCRYFKRKALKKFSAFVNEVRITNAQKLLAETDKSVTDICFQCGFNNLAYFNRQFRNFVRMSPLQYKKQLVIEHE